MTLNTAYSLIDRLLGESGLIEILERSDHYDAAEVQAAWQLICDSWPLPDGPVEKLAPPVAPVATGTVLHIYSDGAAKGNPGPASVGVFISTADGRELWRYGEYIGRATNNQAEYRACIKALELALEFAPAQVMMFCDSELLVKQLNGIYRVKNPQLQVLYKEAKAAIGRLGRVQVRHVMRDKNVVADKLANQAIAKKGIVSERAG